MPRKKKATGNNLLVTQTQDASNSESKPSASLDSSASKPRAHWTPSDDAIMVQVLKEQRAAGNQADNNWKACVWTAVAEEVNKNTLGVPKTAAGCKDHWITVCD